jgi:hypothetical protein
MRKRCKNSAPRLGFVLDVAFLFELADDRGGHLCHSLIRIVGFDRAHRVQGEGVYVFRRIYVAKCALGLAHRERHGARALGKDEVRTAFAWSLHPPTTRSGYGSRRQVNAVAC